MTVYRPTAYDTVITPFPAQLVLRPWLIALILQTLLLGFILGQLCLFVSHARGRGVSRAEAITATAIGVFGLGQWICQVVITDRLLILNVGDYLAWVTVVSYEYWCARSSQFS